MDAIKRYPERARTERTELDTVLDSCPMGTLATVVDGLPWVVPMLFARDGDRVLLHGSTGAGALRQVAEGAPAALCVTLLDGIVVADTLFDSSANYRSAVVRGNLVTLGEEDSRNALDAFSDAMIPGRSREVRRHRSKEVAATMALALPIEAGQWTVKVRDAPPGDPEQPSDVWAGVVPMHSVVGDPVRAPWVPSDTPVPGSVARLVAEGP